MRIDVKKNKILISLFLFANLSLGQNLNISGFVIDASTGENLIGTNILVYEDTTKINISPVRGTATNEFGFYSFSNLSYQNFYLIFRNIGYKTVTKEVKFKQDSKSLRLNTQMQQTDIELKELVVKGKLHKDINISTINISPKTLSLLPSVSGEISIFKSLQLLPGIQVASEISSGLYIRGGSPDQTLTLLDGMPLYNPSHLGNFTSTFNSNAIKNIKLIKGNFPAEYGGRQGSVLDIKLRSGKKSKDQGSFSLGAINSNLSLEGPLVNNATYLISGRWMYFDVLQKELLSNTSTPNYNYKDINLKLTYPIAKDNIISLSAIFSKDHLYSNNNQPDLFYDIGWQNLAVNLNWLSIGSNSLFSNTTVSYVNYTFESSLNTGTSDVTSSDYYASSRLNDFILKKDFLFDVLEDNKLKSGIEFVIHSYNVLASNIFNPFFEVDSELRNSLLAIETSAFVQLESQIGSRLHANIGGRVTYLGKAKYVALEPRISFSYLLTDNFSLKGAFSKAHQFLHLILRNDISLPTDLWLPSTENIKPGLSTQFAFGLENFFHNRSYQISLEGYYRGMKNLYEFKENANFSPYEPIENLFTSGEGEAYGIEFFVSKRTGDLSGWLGYTLSWTKRLFNELNSGKVFFPKYDRRHDLSLVLGYEISNSFSGGLTWTYASGQGITLPPGQFLFNNIALNSNPSLHLDFKERNNYRLPSYHKLDVNLNYNFLWNEKKMEVYISLFNVYNRQNPFAHYISKDESNIDSEKKQKLQMKRITLFPFIPTVGIKFNI